MVKNKDFLHISKQKQDGEWGIFSTDTFLPIVRYDPFCTYLDEKGSKVGHKTIFSPIRRKRPIEFESNLIYSHPTEKNHSLFTDTFCRLIKGELPSIVITKDLNLENDPFSTNPTYTMLQLTTAFSTINLYPPISRILEKNVSTSSKSDFPSGLSLVHIFTKHYAFPEDVSTEEWDIFLQNYSLTIKSSLNHPSISQIENVSVQTFFNIGSRAGGSIPHLHGQSVIFINHTGPGSKLKSYIEASQAHKECLKCEYWTKSQINFFSESISIEERIIARNQDWIAFLVYAPERDAQIRILPRHHVSNLWSLDQDELTSLAPIMIKSNKMLSNFIKHEGENYHLVNDRNIVVRQLINQENNHFHMFIDILPMQQLGGAEAFDNQKFSSEFPETIASKMQSLTIQDE